jgi:class 3 adenylate cyclase
LLAAARSHAASAGSTASPQPAQQSSFSSAPLLQTLLIADVLGYTRYTYEHGDAAGAQLTIRFAALAREAVEARGGRVVELRGDEAFAVFAPARAALHAAVELQARLAAVAAAEPAQPILSGIGLDAGEAVPLDGGYRGLAINLAARLCSLAGPGEVLASEAITHLAGVVPGLRYSDRGTAQLKGFAEPVRLLRVQAAEVGDRGDRHDAEQPLPKHEP